MNVILLGVAVTAGLQAPDSLFRAANAHYAEGRFDQARDAYQTVLTGGVASATVYYNLGNAYFKTGDLGRAALNFERALRLDPRDEDTRANLQLVATLAVDDITPLPGFWVFRVTRWWLTRFSVSGLALISAVGYVLAMAGLGGRILLRPSSLRVWSGRAAVVGASVTLVFGSTLLAADLEVGRPVEAIVLMDEVTVRSAPIDDASLDLFTIHEATKVRIDDRSGAWAEIVLADGQVGWVREEAVEVI